MSITFCCPNPACKQRLTAKEELRGKLLKCPKCAQPVRVPAAHPDAEGTSTPTGQASAQPPPIRKATPSSAAPEAQLSTQAAASPERTPKAPSLRRFPRRSVIAAGAIASTVLLALAITAYFFVGRGSATHQAEPPTPELVANKVGDTAEAVRLMLEQGFRVTGSANFDVLSRRVGITDVTFQRARLNLQLVNGTKSPAQLGQTMMLIETDTGGTNFEGVLAGVRLPPSSKEGDRWDSRGAYGLSTHEERFAAGGRLASGGSIWLLMLPDEGDFTEDTIPQEVAAQGQSPFVMTFRQGAWLKEDVRAGVCLALPEVRVVTQQGTDRYRLVVRFRRSPADANTWEVAQHDWIHLERGQLARLLDAPADSVTRVLIANWWMELDPASGRTALTRLGQTLREGSVLSTCFLLLGQHKDAGLSSHATELLEARGTPSGICMAAAIYLKDLGQDPNLAALVALASGPDDEQARQTIFFLGSLKTHRAVEALQSMLRDPKLSARHKQIRANLERPN